MYSKEQRQANRISWMKKKLLGLKHGNWTVVEFIEFRPVRGVNQSYWRMRCKCGSEKVVARSQIKLSLSCGCAQRKHDYREVAINNLFYKYSYSAKQRNIDWRLTKEEFAPLLIQSCFYCLCPPSSVHQVYYDRPNGRNSKEALESRYAYNGIDRLNNNRGYVFDNVVSCCKVCNQAKNTLTVSEFLSWIERVYQHSVKTNRAIA